MDRFPGALPAEHRASGLRRGHPGHRTGHVEHAGPAPVGNRAAAAVAGRHRPAPAMVPAGGVLTITGSNFLGASPSDTVVSFDAAPGVAAQTVRPRRCRTPRSTLALPTLPAGTRTYGCSGWSPFPPRPHPTRASAPARRRSSWSRRSQPPGATRSTGSIADPDRHPGGRPHAAGDLYIGDNGIPVDERPTSDPDVSDHRHIPRTGEACRPAPIPSGSRSTAPRAHSPRSRAVSSPRRCR